MSVFSQEPDRGDYVRYLERLEKGEIDLPVGGVRAPDAMTLPEDRIPNNAVATPSASSPARTAPAPAPKQPHSTLGANQWGKTQPRHQSVMDELEHDPNARPVTPQAPTSLKERRGPDPMTLQFIGLACWFVTFFGFVVVMENDLDDLIPVFFVFAMVGTLILAWAKRQAQRWEAD